MMKRRAFLASSVAAAAASFTPIPRAMALVAQDDPHRWWAVGTDEMHHPYWARSFEDAARQYAIEYGATVSEECPECGEYMCHRHNPDLNAPAPWVEGRTFDSWADIGPEKPPTTVEWLRVGYNVPCEGCSDWEPTECYEFRGEALCCECLENAKIQQLDQIVGTSGEFYG